MCWGSPWRQRQRRRDVILRAVTSDGAQGLSAYLKRRLSWVHHQRCVWHLWRTLSSDIRQAAQGLEGDAATQAREQAKQALKTQIHNVLDAETYDQAEQALLTLSNHPLADKITKALNHHLDRLLVLDDFGLKPLHPPAHEDPYDIINLRYERGSILLTSNRAPEEWPDLFGNPLLASAGLEDRLPHRAHVVVITASSFRTHGPHISQEKVPIEPSAPS